MSSVRSTLIFAPSSAGFNSIKGNRFRKGYPQRIQQLFPRRFLAIDAGHLLNPTNPPIRILLYDSCVRLQHYLSSHAETTRD